MSEEFPSSLNLTLNPIFLGLQRHLLPLFQLPSNLGIKINYFDMLEGRRIFCHLNIGSSGIPFLLLCYLILWNIAKDRKVIPDPIDDRKFQETEIFWTLTACHHFSQNLLNSRSGVRMAVRRGNISCRRNSQHDSHQHSLCLVSQGITARLKCYSETK